MKPHIKHAETVTPDGTRLALYEHDGHFCFRLNGQELMHSGAMASELLLGELCVARKKAEAPNVLIGGLGLGFTLKSVLENVGPRAKVQVAELVPEVVTWNKEFLMGMNGRLLEDSRVEVVIGDVYGLIEKAEPMYYDAIALDVDNGPTPLVQQRNARLYKTKGLLKIIDALKPGGRAVFWSAREDPDFLIRLTKAGFRVEPVPAKLHAGARRCTYMIYVADL
ncbi:MAG: spermine synthase [Verrucomicrobiota bacterium]|nr:spermine synthase [Verrucomicrobiota bacterium]